MNCDETVIEEVIRSILRVLGRVRAYGLSRTDILLNSLITRDRM